MGWLSASNIPCKPNSPPLRRSRPFIAQYSSQQYALRRSRLIRWVAPIIIGPKSRPKVHGLCPSLASLLFFACPKKSNKKKGSLSGSAYDLRGLRCFWQAGVHFSEHTVVFRPAKKGAPSYRRAHPLRSVVPRRRRGPGQGMGGGQKYTMMKVILVIWLM